jgi:ABC-type multidrug transport system fused ATPase/permease subunit
MRDHLPFASLPLIFRLLRPYPWVLPGVAVLGVLASLAEGIGIGLLIPFLAQLMGAGSTDGGFIVQITDQYARLFDEDMRLIMVGATIVVLIVGRCFLNFGYVGLLTFAGTQVTHDLRSTLFRHYLDVSYATLSRRDQGQQVNALDGSCYRAGQAVMDLLLLIVNAATAAIFVMLLLLISWKMTLAIICGVGLAGLVTRVLINRGHRTGKSVETGGAALNDTVVQALDGMRMIRIYGQEDRQFGRFADASNKLRKAQQWLEFAWRAMAPLIDLLYVPLLLGAMILAWYANIGMTVLLPFLFLVFRLQRYVREFDMHRLRFASRAPAIAEINELLQEPDPEPIVSGERSFARLEDQIAFRGVTYSFNRVGGRTKRPALHGIDLEIKRGETIALVGGSGAGKSTLVNLLCRIYDPSAGAIEIDGVPLPELNLRQWRSRIGFAGQDAELRPGTVAENIAYGEPRASLERIKNAARKAHIHNFIESLPSGYETAVGVRGTQLSGGERQRIALARALLREPDVLILDEATNAVDNFTEIEIGKALAELRGSITVIIIAHRLTSTRGADRIVVMQDGRIVEVGRRPDLLKDGGVFSQLIAAEAEPAA